MLWVTRDIDCYLHERKLVHYNVSNAWSSLIGNNNALGQIEGKLHEEETLTTPEYM